jgi:hypothetical protein
VAAALVAAVLTVQVRSDEPIASSVTFNREIYRILESRCLACHAPRAPATRRLRTISA